MARRMFNPMTIFYVIAAVALLVCFVSSTGRDSHSAARSRSPFGDGALNEPRMSSCPFACDCKGLTVDCANQGLRHVPRNLPTNARRLHLQGNNISLIRREDFLGMSSLKILDLRNNQISEIEDAAFEGASSLNELILFQNKLDHIRSEMFIGLRYLKALLLNTNNISSVRRDAFSGLFNLHLLSLYDNKIQTLVNGTFSPLVNIQTLHLGKNPFVCDCHLKWLAIFLQANPIETSDARCEEPKRLHKRRLPVVDESKFKCKNTKHFDDCPVNCTCTGSVIRCNNQRLADAPVAMERDSEEEEIEKVKEEVKKDMAEIFDKEEIMALTKESQRDRDDREEREEKERKERAHSMSTTTSPASTSTTTAMPQSLSSATEMFLNLNDITAAPLQSTLSNQLHDLSQAELHKVLKNYFCAAPSCQKETYLDYYEEDGCQSAKKMKLAECVGSCGEHCCTASKKRKRPVKMVCADGSVYTKHIEIIRKCACNKDCTEDD